MTRRLMLLLALAVLGCAKKEAPAPAATDSGRTSVGMGGSQVVPRFVGIWQRPSPVRPGQQEAMTMAAGGALTLGNICTEHGISWQELPDNILGLTSRTDEAHPQREERYTVRAFTSTMLVLKGDGYLGGRWTRSTTDVQDSCATR
jgi:hypothetical protein